MAKEHRTCFTFNELNRNFGAKCSCGWEQGYWPTVGQAGARINEHQRMQKALRSQKPVWTVEHGPRVHEVGMLWELRSKAVLDILGTLGLTRVRTASSTLTMPEYIRFCNHMAS